MDIENYLEVAKNKINNKKNKTFILSIYAGIFISLAAISSTIASLATNNYYLSKIFGAIIFPIGLILVILTKTELFTGNSLLIIPLLENKITLKQLLKNWIIVFLGNLFGSLLITIIIINTPLKEVLSEAFIKIANTKISISFHENIILGILCNFLVCLAVYLSSNTKNIVEKILVIAFPIFIFIIMSLEHSVANMFYLSIGYILDNTITIKEIFVNNLIPVTIGNIIGGTTLSISLWYLRNEKNN